jgi:hypothetical protein
MLVVTRKIDLSEYSEDWKGCYVKLRELSAPEVQTKLPAIAEGGKDKDGKVDNAKAIQGIIDIVKDCFIEGKGFNGKEIVDIAKDDVDFLPLSMLKDFFGFLAVGSKVKTTQPLNS